MNSTTGFDLYLGIGSYQIYQSNSLLAYLGTAVALWLRCCATNRKVACSFRAGVSGFFIDIKSFRSHYGPGVDSASNINEYQEYFLGGKGGRCVRLIAYHHPVPLSRNLGTLTSWNRLGLSRPVMGLLLLLAYLSYSLYCYMFSLVVISVTILWNESERHIEQEL